MAEVRKLHSTQQTGDNFTHNTIRKIQNSLIIRIMEWLVPYSSIDPADLDRVFCEVIDRLTLIRAEEREAIINNYTKKKGDKDA